MNLMDAYKPYDFSKSKCHVVSIDTFGEQALKVEEKLPLHIRRLKGIHITCNSELEDRVIGYVTLQFNEGILKTAQLPILNSQMIKDHSNPIPINEEIKCNGLMLGYMYFLRKNKLTHSVKIYLHYETV